MMNNEHPLSVMYKSNAYQQASEKIRIVQRDMRYKIFGGGLRKETFAPIIFCGFRTFMYWFSLIIRTHTHTQDTYTSSHTI